MGWASVSAALLTVVALVAAQTHFDATQTEEAQGNKVVDAVVDRIQASCVFPEDKVFFRRLAFVESNDGQHPKTYREDYHGGIWQVDEEMFDVTQDANARVILFQYIKGIQTNFNIDWPSVTWQDCRKPLQSALAAMLYTAYKARGVSGGIPRDIEEQANFWEEYYHPGGDKEYFVTASNQLEKGCDNKGVDLVFVMDGSGSIGSKDFRKVREFVKDVVKSFDIGPDKTRTAMIKFSTSVTIEWYFGTHETKEAVLAAADDVRYLGGGTNTHVALDTMVHRVFTTETGARPIEKGHPRVAIVMTDGKSNKPPLTIINALRAHDADITMFAVGVGAEIDMNELEAIASDPLCLNLYLLSNFNEMQSLKAAIERRTCQAPIIISPGNNGSIIDGIIPPGGDQNCKIKIGDEGVTVKVSTKTGHVKYFLSKSTFPSEIFYDYKLQAYPGHRAVVFLDRDTAGKDGLLYCNIKGDEDEESDVEIGSKPGDTDHCKNDPCENGGVCIDEGDDYSCQCFEGFTGKNCETDIDECDPDPCVHGECLDGVNDYNCVCDPGYTGENCDQEIDYCTPNPCEHGTCENKDGSYECCCDDGWTGDNCEIELNPCESDPCNNGACENQEGGGYKCNCHPGFTGEFCTEDIDECADFPCVNGECQDGHNHNTCECYAGWTGKDCDVEIDECASNPCHNGGQCVDQEARYICDCEDGWTGTHCDQEVDECASGPCVEGSCEDRKGHYVCHCHPGWTGTHCDKPEDECTPDKCIHGTCQDLGNGFECCCDHGWTGENCDTDIDECASDPCVNGECIDGDNQYQCVCHPGYTGQHCEVDIDECESNPCLHGDCEDQVNGYVCNCRPGWTGTNCDIDIDECESNPCINGDCVDGENHYRCECWPGWTGDHCEIDIDECESDPCHHGECIDKENGYDCDCHPGWTGDHCETDIDECESNPCVHGSCEDKVNGYVCHCEPGYTGDHCEIDIDECESNPCVHGVCDDKVNGYVCICDPGYTGTHCEIDIDECASNPCVHGTCHDQVNGYVCTCDPGWTNTNCDCLVDSCESNPCKNGICENEVGGYSCHCNVGWTGPTCENPIGGCHSDPCQNGATCHDDINNDRGYTCECAPGWTGDNCDCEIDWCQSNPCKNGGTCDSSPGGWTCTCPPRYTGRRCGWKLKPCKPNPCAHGHCNEKDDDSFTCECYAGWMGELCDTDHPCEPDPCNNGGECHVVEKGPRLPAYRCDCPDGFSGPTCGDEEIGSGDEPELLPEDELALLPEVEGGRDIYNCKRRNPCTPENAEEGRFFFRHRNPRRFIQCSEWGDCNTMKCPPGLIWNQKDLTCDWPKSRPN